MSGHKNIIRVAIVAILVILGSGMLTAPPAVSNVGCYPTLESPCSDWTRVQSGELVFDYHNGSQKMRLIIQRDYASGYWAFLVNSQEPVQGSWLEGQGAAYFEWACEGADPLYTGMLFDNGAPMGVIYESKIITYCGGTSIPAVQKMTGKTTRHQAQQFCSAKGQIAKRKKRRALRKARHNGSSRFHCVKPKRAHKRPFGS
jgi:hypothetical protein